MVIKVDSYIPGAYGLSGVKSLHVEDDLYANQVRANIAHPGTTVNYKFKKLGKYTLLRGFLFVCTASYTGGTIKIGYDASTGVDAYVADTNIPKTHGQYEFYPINELEESTITPQIQVAGAPSTGAGICWMFSEALL